MLGAGVDNFLNQDDAILNVSTFYKATLIFRNDTRKDLFEMVCNDFSDYFVPCIAERDRPKSGKALGPFLFGN